MTIQTSRFGAVQVTEEDVIVFTEGLLGFSHLSKFVLLDDPNEEIFAWLQSCENSEVAFPVLEPELFATDTQISLTKKDMEALRLTPNSQVRFFTIVTVPEDPTQMTANLKAPIAINVRERMAKQCVLQDHNLNIREPIFLKLQQRVFANPANSIKSQASDWGVAVKLPEDEQPDHRPDPRKELTT